MNGWRRWRRSGRRLPCGMRTLKAYRRYRRITGKLKRYDRNWRSRCRSMFWKDFVEGSSPDATLGQSFEAFEEVYGIFGIRNVERMHKEVVG